MSCSEKTVVSTDQAPKAIGPYSVAIKANGLVFTAGQIGLIPETGVLVEGGIEAETRQALTNLKNVLGAAGSCLDCVLKTTVFLRDMNDFAAMNGVYAQFFTQDFPARSAFAVASLPKGACVEIECVAALCNGECDCK
jgi:2-iminobutanoate/2-iminopropanoate deaminase